MNNKENYSSVHKLSTMFAVGEIFAGNDATLDDIPDGEARTADIFCSRGECIINYLFLCDAEGVFVSSVKSNGPTNWKVRVTNRSSGPATVSVTPVIFRG